MTFRKFLLFALAALCSPVRYAEAAEPTEPIELRLSCSKSYIAGEPILLLVEAQNTSDRPQEIKDLSGGWANYEVLNFDVQPKNSKNRPYRAGAGIDHYVAPSGAPLTLQPTDTSAGEFDLAKDSVTVATGRYTVTASYRIMDQEGRPRFVKSNPVSFDLAEPNEDDRQVIQFLGWKHFAGGLNMDATDDYFYTQLGYEQKYLSVLREHPNSTFSKYAAFYLARYYSAKGRGKEAMPILKHLTEEQQEFALTDDALLLLAQGYLAEPGEQDKGQSILEKIVSKFSKGNCARDARRKLDELKGHKNKE